jgi:hypothetical protein
VNLNDVKNEVLSKLDIETEFELLGVVIADSSSVSSSGWIKCHSYSSTGEDRNPSAGICVSGDKIGRYREFTGDGLSMNLFDFAAHVGKFKDWIEALRHYAEKVGVDIPKGGRGRPKKEWQDSVEFAPGEFNELLVTVWCQKNPPITPHVLKVSGCRLGSYPKKTKEHSVISIPCYGEKLVDDDPIGSQIMHIGGKLLPVYQGKGVAPRMCKIYTVSGSRSGWMGRFGLSILSRADVVWFVEGPKDMLALQSVIMADNHPCQRCSESGVDPEMPDKPCQMCEGKKTHSPYLQKHAVVTNSGGCLELIDEKYLKHLKGKKVFVVPDCDVDGQKGGIKKAKAISVVASECRIVKLPYSIEPNHGKDLRDFINDPGQFTSYENLLLMAESSELITPDQKKEKQETVKTEDSEKPFSFDVDSDDENDSLRSDNPAIASSVSNRPNDSGCEYEKMVLESLQLDVIGEDDDLAVEVFSAYHGKNRIIKDVKNLSYERLLQICGPIAKKIVNLGGDEIPGTFRMATIKNSISVLAGYVANNGIKNGLGCWQAKLETGEDEDSIILVGGYEAAKWNHSTKKLHRVKTPRCGGLILKLQNHDLWYDFEKLQSYLEQCDDPEWATKVVNEATKLFSNWNWKNSIHPIVLTGLIIASWVETIWDWRPLVAVSGPTDAGKTSFFNTVEKMYGGLALKSSKSSEAGIRQAVRSDACILLCDEFESDRHRQQILDFFRTSSRGDKTLRGNMSQTGERYGLKHICWVAAIEVGLKREPDKNRFIEVELRRPKEGTRGKMEWMPSDVELAELGMKLLAIGLRYVKDAKALSDTLKSFSYPNIHGRVIESYSVPVSILVELFIGDRKVCPTIALCDENIVEWP